MSNPLLDRLQVEKLQVSAQIQSFGANIGARAWTGEEETAFLQMNDDLGAKNTRIAELLQVEQRNAAVESRVAEFERTAPNAFTGAEKADRDFVAFLRKESRGNVASKDAFDVRALSKGTATAGGNAVPTSFYSEFQRHLIDNATMLQTPATVLRTRSGEDLQMPKSTAHSTAALVTEGGTIGTSEPTFGLHTLKAYKYGLIIYVPHELLIDESVDLVGYLAQQAGEACGLAANAHWVTGTGTAQPAGIVTGSTLGKTAAGAAALTLNELIDLQHSVISPYRNSPGAGWLMKDSTVAYVRKIQDTDGHHIWQPSLVAGQPDRLLGKPVYADQNVAAMATGAKSIVYGALGRFYIREVEGVRFERSDDFKFDTDVVSFRCLYRADSVLLDQTGAVKHLAQA